MKRSKLSFDAKHKLGSLMMWGSVVVAWVGTLDVSWLDNWGRLGVFLLALATACGGAILKKRNCPRCRENACGTESPAQATEPEKIKQQIL